MCCNKTPSDLVAGDSRMVGLDRPDDNPEECRDTGEVNDCLCDSPCLANGGLNSLYRITQIGLSSYSPEVNRTAGMDPKEI